MAVKSVIECLSQQSIGLMKPLAVQRSVNSYFMQGLELSKHKSVEEVHQARVIDLDIDTTENRYLLSGSSAGSVAIHDLLFLRENEHGSGTADSRMYKVVGSALAGSSGVHKNSVSTVQWYPLDTGLFTSSGLDKVLKIWDANLFKPAEQFVFKSVVRCHHMSSVTTRHSLIGVGTDSCSVYLADPRCGSVTHRLSGHKNGAVTTMQWSNRDEYILATGGSDSFAILWDVRTSRYVKKFQKNKQATHDGCVCGVGFTADGLHLVTFGTDRKFYMWDTWTGRQVPRRYPKLSQAPKAPPKFCMTTGGSQNFVYIPTGLYISSFSLTSPDRVDCLYGHHHRINCCVYHSTENQLISGGNDHEILVYTQKNRDYVVKDTTEVNSQTMDTWSDDDG